MTIIDSIKENFSNSIVKLCSEKKCKLKTYNLKNYVILKGEKVCKNIKISDCIIFKGNGDLIIGIVELKSKTIHANDILKKLNNGSEIALNILKKYSKNLKYEIYHIVLAKRWNSTELETITKRKISIDGKGHKIINGRCGNMFSDLVEKAKKSF